LKLVVEMPTSAGGSELIVPRLSRVANLACSLIDANLSAEF
jgi:hypothetical protein